MATGTERPCSCGNRSRPHINHRVSIPCWTFIGRDRVDVQPWSDQEHRLEESRYYDRDAAEWVHVVICTNAEHDPCPAERELFRQRREA